MLKKILACILWLCAAGALFALAVNGAVVMGTRAHIVSPDAATAQAAIVPGAMVWGQTPSYMLADRLDMALQLYQNDQVQKILVSGDHGRSDYDEVTAMRDYLLQRGVPEDDVFMDHAGFDTYSTMYRARKIFQVESAVVVTQQYHLYRALYIARAMGMDAAGVPCDNYISPRQAWYSTREALARVKDFINCQVLRPQPKYLGEVIPIAGSGRATWD